MYRYRSALLPALPPSTAQLTLIDPLSSGSVVLTRQPGSSPTKESPQRKFRFARTLCSLGCRFRLPEPLRAIPITIDRWILSLAPALALFSQ